MDHPHFQRMRRVRQLGPLHLIYPGATHTRFEHSLGVYGNALDYLRVLLADPNVAQSMTEADLVVGFLGPLLHDIGHYPFAHSLEAAHVEGLNPPRHEALAEALIFGRLPGSSSAGPSIAQAIEAGFGVNAEEVVQLIREKADRHPAPMRALVATILSSAMDADKADYLERDAHHMGLSIGAGFDRHRFLRALVAHPNGRSIALQSRGRMVAESFIFARYAMFSEGYWHHTARAVASMVEAALRDFREHSALTDEALTSWLITMEDEPFLERIVEHSPEGSDAWALLSRLTRGNRRIHKRILTLSLSYDDVAIQAAYEKVYGMSAVDRVALCARLRETVSRRVGRALGGWELLIDTPPRDKDRMEDVAIVDGLGRVTPLSRSSQVVRGIAGDFSRVVKKIRVYVSEDVRASLRASGTEWALREELLEVIYRFSTSDEGQPSLFG